MIVTQAVSTPVHTRAMSDGNRRKNPARAGLHVPGATVSCGVITSLDCSTHSTTSKVASSLTPVMVPSGTHSRHPHLFVAAPLSHPSQPPLHIKESKPETMDPPGGVRCVTRGKNNHRSFPRGGKMNETTVDESPARLKTRRETALLKLFRHVPPTWREKDA